MKSKSAFQWLSDKTGRRSIPNASPSMRWVFLAADPERLDRFLALTGLAPDALRLAAREPGFLVAVIDHLMADDDLIRSFSAEHRLRPEAIADAHRALSGAGSEFA